MLLQKVKSLLSDDSGAVMVLVAIGLVVFLGCMALVVDAGVLYAENMKASNAVDAAVLAGARELPNKDEAIAVAKDYAEYNGLEAKSLNPDVTFTVSDDCKTITGVVDKDTGMFFARVFGINTGDVGAHAKAIIGVVGSIKGSSHVVPLGVHDQELTYGQLVTLKEDGGDGVNGWFGALDLPDVYNQTTGNGAKKFGYFLKNGYTPEIKIGDVISVEPGNMAGKSYDGLNTRLDGCNHTPACSMSEYDENCSRVVIVPVGEVSTDHGSNRTLTVTGFAAFLISDYSEGSGNGKGGKGKDCEIEGYFLHYVIPGNASNTAVDYGVHTIQLSE